MFDGLEVPPGKAWPLPELPTTTTHGAQVVRRLARNGQRLLMVDPKATQSDHRYWVLVLHEPLAPEPSTPEGWWEKEIGALTAIFSAYQDLDLLVPFVLVQWLRPYLQSGRLDRQQAQAHYATRTLDKVEKQLEQARQVFGRLDSEQEQVRYANQLLDVVGNRLDQERQAFDSKRTATPAAEG